MDNCRHLLAAHRLIRCGRVEIQRIRSSAYLPENLLRSEELEVLCLKKLSRCSAQGGS